MIIKKLPHLKILVAEDSVINQRILQAKLHQLQQSVDIVSNGQLALERLAEQSYDIVMLDIMMPIMGGEETLNCIRRSEARIAQHHCIAWTADSFQEQGNFLLGLGFDQFFSKAQNMNGLYNLLLKASQKPCPLANFSIRRQRFLAAKHCAGLLCDDEFLGSQRADCRVSNML